MTFQFLHLIGSIFFALAAYVQINDPDPEIWVAVYSLPAFLSFCTALNPKFTENEAIKHVNEMITVGYCIYGGFILDSSYTFENDVFYWIIHAEAGREFGGLVIVTFWTAFMHGSARSMTTLSVVMMSALILVPSAFWLYIYFNKCFRSLWPEHCQTALYPD